MFKIKILIFVNVYFYKMMFFDEFSLRNGKHFTILDHTQDNIIDTRSHQ